ncbi:MAG: threonylcarbamoyl-AMP synthase [Gammaproteobacteria bacterium]|jgi:tRNA threonylcarbamoyl adenosine modification protein (Sua5/YciO/YrdC/YwlC family)|nr:threonylcarbamoyl-AMP synthase [Gammaproteobacteria bacterium]
MTQRLDVHPTHPQARLLKVAAQALHQGELIAYPSDTTYALACHVGDKAAMEKLIQLRQLEKNHQFTLACRDLSELSAYARVENADYRLLKRNTPGPFTFILQASKDVPKRLVHPKKRTIGLHIPDHPVAQGLLDVLEEPMLTSSLRLPGDDTCLQEGEEIIARLKNQIAVLLDSGACGVVPSTVVDLTQGHVEIVRQGAGELV